MWWPLMLMTTSCRPCSSHTILAMLIPVVSWRYRATARAAMTMVRWAQVASRVWWKTGRAGRSCLLMRNDCPGVPQLVVGGDDLTGVHQAGRHVGDVALEAHQGPGSGDGRFIEVLIALMDGDKTRALGTLLAGDDGPGAVGLSCEGLVVPGRSLLGVDPYRSP